MATASLKGRGKHLNIILKMVKRLYRRRTARKRFRKYKRRLRRRAGYDGVFKAKIIRTFNMTAASNIVAANIMWG